MHRQSFDVVATICVWWTNRKGPGGNDASHTGRSYLWSIASQNAFSCCSVVQGSLVITTAFVSQDSTVKTNLPLYQKTYVVDICYSRLCEAILTYVSWIK